MKIRNGFVSNSSSSSFIVIATRYRHYGDDYYCFRDKYKDEVLKINPDTNEFGWQFEEYKGFHTKAAFCYLMSDREEDREMLEDVITDRTGCSSIDWSLVQDGYIDHDSKGSPNDLMFSDRKLLELFLFSSDSKIVNQNDNG